MALRDMSDSIPWYILFSDMLINADVLKLVCMQRRPSCTVWGSTWVVWNVDIRSRRSYKLYKWSLSKLSGATGRGFVNMKMYPLFIIIVVLLSFAEKFFARIMSRLQKKGRMAVLASSASTTILPAYPNVELGRQHAPVALVLSRSCQWQCRHIEPSPK